MPLLEYKAPGDRIDAAAMAAVFTEFERKMGLLLSGKSFLASAAICARVIGATDARPMGYATAHYRDAIPDRRIATADYAAFLPRYDHQVYTDAVDALTVLEWDNTKGIVWCQPPLIDLDASMQCHTLISDAQPHRIALGEYPTAWVRAQKRYRYAVAELVCEQLSALSIPDEWDKYSCFRIHNLSRDQALTVRFGEHHSLVIGPLCCRTVRRTAVDGEYAEGVYFWPHQVGDPTLYCGGGFTVELGDQSSRIPELSLAANNLTNPSILFWWIRTLTSPDVRSQFGFDVDPSVFASIWDDYAPLFADPSAAESRIGDLVVHRGSLRVAQQKGDRTTELHTVTWRGFGGPVPDLLERTINADGSVTFGGTLTDPCDLVGETCNLVAAATAGASVCGLPVTVPGNLVTMLYPAQPEQIVGESRSLWVDEVTGQSQSATMPTRRRGLQINQTADFGPLNPISDITSILTAANARILAIGLTPIGPWVVCEQDVDITLPDWEPMGVVRSGDRIIRRFTVSMPLGWAEDTHGRTLTLAARVPRIHAPFGVRDGDLVVPDLSDDGLIEREWIQQDPPLDGSQSSIQLQGLALPTARNNPELPTYLVCTPPDNVAAILDRSGEGSTWYQDNRDALIGEYRPDLDPTPRYLRVPVLAEHWNHMAQAVNSLHRCRPLTIEDVEWITSDGRRVFLAPDPSGLQREDGTTSSIRPVTQYAKIFDADLQAWLVEQSVPIRTAADLPQSWRDAAAARAPGTNTQWYGATFRRQYGAAVIEDWPELYPPGHPLEGKPLYQRVVAPATESYVTHGTIAAPSGPFVIELGWEMPNAATDTWRNLEYNWIQVDDVSDLAARLGLPLIHQVIGRPLRVALVDSELPQLASWSRSSASGRYETPWYLYADARIASEFDRLNNRTYDSRAEWSGYAKSLRWQEVDELAAAEFIGAPDYLGYSAHRTDTRLDLDAVVSELGENRETRATGEVNSEGFHSPVMSYVSLVFSDGVPASVRSIDALELRTLCRIAKLSDGLEDQSFAVLTGLWSVTRQPDYQLTSRSTWQNYQVHGDLARPAAAHPQNDGSARISSAGGNTLVACMLGERCMAATIVHESTLSL